ncbi:MAG: hypothetical protein ACRDJN_25280, partial [Chloroflexota bacterium]
HPLTGAQLLRLRLWAGGAELVEARPATETEATGLQAGSLPSLSAADDAALAVDLRAAEQALQTLDHRPPADAIEARRRLAEIDADLSGPPPLFDQDAYIQARAEVAGAERRQSEAAARCAELPEAATLQRRATGARRELTTAKRACTASARQLGLAETTVDGLLDEIPAVIPMEQARYEALATAVGKRDGLQSQLAELNRNGHERVRELDECRQNLAADSEAELYARQQALAAQHATGVAEAADLYAAVAAVAGGGASLTPGRHPALLSAMAAGAGDDGTAAGQLSSQSTERGQDGTADHNGAIGAPGAASALELAGVAESGPGVALLWQALQRRCDALGGEAAVLEDQAAALVEVEARVAAATETLTAVGEELSAALAEADLTPWPPSPRGKGERQEDSDGLRSPFPSREGGGMRGAQGAGPREGVRSPLDPEAAQALANRHAGALDGELRALDEPAVRAAEQDAQRAVWAADERLQRLVEETRQLAESLVALAGELGHAVPAPDAPAPPQPGTLAAVLRETCPEVAGDLPSWEQTEATLVALRQREWDLERRAQDARLTLGDEAPVALTEAEQALAALELDLAARRRAQDIIAQTRQRMINKVLPDTMRNMCLLLPLLTAGRYRYAELTQDYRLQVWDERKRGYVEKNLYSGGTQDQFSLALRLGFALAALPRELGTSPGFLFLDEPLSSFDRDRTAALIDLLTHGQIATFFHQVFLISHSQAFDPGRFSHHIVMEEGRVASSTLPE